MNIHSNNKHTYWCMCETTCRRFVTTPIFFNSLFLAFYFMKEKRQGSYASDLQMLHQCFCRIPSWDNMTHCLHDCTLEWRPSPHKPQDIATWNSNPKAWGIRDHSKHWKVNYLSLWKTNQKYYVRMESILNTCGSVILS